MDSRKVAELKAFVELCGSNPSILHLPELGFVRAWLKGSVIAFCISELCQLHLRPISTFFFNMVRKQFFNSVFTPVGLFLRDRKSTRLNSSHR